jgi:DNA-binding transcriptional regulator YhcF (GntR family)
MLAPALVNPLPELPGPVTDLYDVGDTPGLAGEQMPASDSASIAEVAASIRARIFSREFLPGAKLPSSRVISRENKISEASAMVALRMLREEGLVDLVHGSGTYVRRLRRYRVTAWATGPAVDVRRVRTLSKSFSGIVRESAAADDPAVDWVGDGETRWSVTVRAADIQPALATGLHLAERAAGEDHRFVRSDVAELPDI